jgi:hypothetical protein
LPCHQTVPYSRHRIVGSCKLVQRKVSSRRGPKNGSEGKLPVSVGSSTALSPMSFHTLVQESATHVTNWASYSLEHTSFITHSLAAGIDSVRFCGLPAGATGNGTDILSQCDWIEYGKVRNREAEPPFRILFRSVPLAPKKLFCVLAPNV